MTPHIPKISIGLPCLNVEPFIKDRMDTILSQTFTDWELVVVDGESNDGTYEYLCKLAAADDRIRLEQTPANGNLRAFNRCFDLARGEYVYIATADDTMADDCLEKLFNALEANPDCDLAHCPLKVIDERGEESSPWWTTESIFVKSSGDWIDKPHKRVAPHDALLCMLGDNVYTSVTQLLIRRSLYERIGGYSSDWGGVGDFHWNLKASLATSTVHVPDTWASWRVHDAQVTAGSSVGSDTHQKKIDSMIEDVMGDLEKYTDAETAKRLRGDLGTRVAGMRDFLRGFDGRLDSSERKAMVLKGALKGSPEAMGYIGGLLPGRKRWPRHAPETVRDWMEKDAYIALT